jgi:thermitase
MFLREFIFKTGEYKMRYINVFLIVFLTASIAFSKSDATNTINWNGKDVEAASDYIMVGLKSIYTKANLSDQIRNSGISIDRDPDVLNIARLKIPENGKSLTQYISDLQKKDIFRFVEPDVVINISTTPNDTYYNNQWALPKVNAPDGWDIQTGDDDIVIGVLDSGIPMQSGSLSHPDLDNTSIITLGTDEVGDGNGVMDENGHGTHVAGIINAESNNSTGIAGTSWGCKLKIYQVFDDEGSGLVSYFEDAVIHAVDNGCSVLNFSGGTTTASQTLEDGVEYAYDEGVILVAAAGNYDYYTNPNKVVEYPAAYSDSYDNVIAVSATTSGDALASFSSSGSDVVVAAPGDNIYSTTPGYEVYLTNHYLYIDEDYDYMSGTSMAAPLVAGQAGLIWSQYPTLDYDEVIDQITRTANDLGTTGRDNSFGYGRVDVGKSLTEIYVPDQFSTINSACTKAESGQSIIVDDGTHAITANATVNSGVALEIEDGATVNIDAGKYIYVEGTLIADGTSGSGITFDKSGANRWGGIRFEDSSVDGECSLTYCTVKNASYAVYCNSSDPYIANNTIQYTSVGITLQYPNATTAKVNNNVMNNLGFYGIYQNQGDSEIYSNEIQDAGIGIYIIDGDSKIQGNSIYDSNTEGVQLDGTGPTMTNNMIFDNGYNGIYCYDYSDPTFRLAYQGNNVIAYNTRNGVSITSTSTADLTTYSNPSTSANSLYNNGASYYEVYSLQSSTTDAQYNWWGESPPDGDRLYGDVDNSNYRSSDPNDDPPGHKILVFPPDPSQFNDEEVDGLPSNPNALKILQEGYMLQGQEKYDYALVKFQKVISDYPESFEAMLALSRVRKCFKMAERLSNLGSYLSTIYEPNKNNKLGGKVLEMQIPFYVKNKSYDEALANCATIINNFPDDEMAKSALHNTWMINNDFKKDLVVAKTTMDQYGAIYPNDETHLLMKLTMGEITSEQADAQRNSLLKSKEPVNDKDIVPVEFKVSQNYPNPFNP